jgi:hypothetical protein
MRSYAVGFVITALLPAGCVSMTLEAESVRVVRNSNDVQTCQRLGEIESTSGWGGVFAGAGGLENNKRTLRNRTAKLGGDTLLILQERATFAPHTYGEAYRCQK